MRYGRNFAAGTVAPDGPWKRTFAEKRHGLEIDSRERIRLFQNSEDLIEGIIKFADPVEGHGESPSGIGPGGNVTIGEQNVSGFLPVVGARPYVKRSQVGGC